YLIIVAGRPSMGKAQALDARIKTRTGWKEMGELQVGDALASIDGAPSIVTGVYPQGVRQVYRLTFTDGRSAEACAEHLWRVHARTWEQPRILSTSDLMDLVDDRPVNRFWIDRVSGHFGHDEALPVEPWALGASLGARQGGVVVESRIPVEYLNASRSTRMALLRGILDMNDAPEARGERTFRVGSRE